MQRLTTFVAMSFVTCGLTTVVALVLMTCGLHTSFAKPAPSAPAEAAAKEAPSPEARLAMSEPLAATNP